MSHDPGTPDPSILETIDGHIAGLMRTTSIEAAMPRSHSDALKQINDFNRHRTAALDGPLARHLEAVTNFQRTISSQMDALRPAQEMIDAWNRSRPTYSPAIDEIVAFMQQRDELLTPFEALREQLADLASWAPLQRQLAVLQASTQDWKDLHTLVPESAIDRLKGAATTTALRVEAEQAQAEPPATVAAVTAAMGRADLDELKAVLEEVVRTIVASAITQLKPKTRRQWLKVVGMSLLAIWHVLSLTSQIVGQPLFQRWMDHKEPAHPAPASAPPILQQLAVVRGQEVFVRIGPHTRQRYMTKVHRGDLVRVIRRSGRWSLVSVAGRGNQGAGYTGWIKSDQTVSLETQAASLMTDAMVPPQR